MRNSLVKEEEEGVEEEIETHLSHVHGCRIPRSRSQLSHPTVTITIVASSRRNVQALKLTFEFAQQFSNKIILLFLSFLILKS